MRTYIVDHNMIYEYGFEKNNFKNYGVGVYYR